MAKTYTAHVGGRSWSVGPTAEYPTITDCRKWAEEYGTTADWCSITDSKGREVGSPRRDSNGDGTRWYRASF
ncbi:hypothetical protein UFOVP469_24 [uncultured Caudovirales phage]|uniref:Uncharacterized protein n=1 Tax=uncultured Caudovirales phage TaxID=2100421 RepID=A0A6J5R7H3_9CAUD|nr:hypothetical protein UFOVP469_24 [uncultured Caudovirales phage]CAB4190337.1 hypothetical protein UFOVP1200_54 [uncultured Caudovirales phage]